MVKKAKSLVIVESPAKSKTINKYLGKDYNVTFSMGHVMDLPRGKMGIDIENGFKPEYIVIAARRKNVTRLKKEAKGVERIYLAPDPDREGEVISWHLSQLLGKGKEVYRVSFNEITEKAILDAFAHPHSLDENRINAQQARRILDRLVGYNLSPILWKKVGRGLSAGRVQSVAVRIIVDREREIRKFIPDEYWHMEAELSRREENQKRADDKKHFIAKLDKIDGKKADIKDQKSSKEILSQIGREEFIVSEIKESKKKKSPQAPFTTSKLQQDAFNKLRFSASKTMKMAQSLYEGVEMGDEGSAALITYMRTDSVRISKDAQTDARNFITINYGKDYCPVKPNHYKSKKSAQEAHEAIRPTLPLRRPEDVKQFLSDDQYKLYELIWRRFLASQMTPSLYAVQNVEIKAGRFRFKITGSHVLFPGFMSAYPTEEKKEVFFPRLTKDEKLNLLRLIPTQHFTKAPPRYSEGSLVKALEEDGIGRPSTYAPIIYTIVARNYIERQRGYLYPTDLGEVVTDLLVEHFPKVMEVEFTARMEEELDEVEDGKMDWVDVLKDFYGGFKDTVEHAKANMKNIKKEVIPTDKVCQLCGAPMVIKWGRRGKFLSCSTFPKCKHAMPISSGVKCPQEGCNGELVQRRSRRGPFYGCTSYPKCTFTTEKLPESEEPKKETEGTEETQET